MNLVTFNDTTLHSCFALVVKMHKLSEPWRHVIARKVLKRSWEILDEFGETVLETVEDTGDTKLTDLWGKWFKHPNVSDYKNSNFYKQNLQISGSDLRSYDKIVYSLKENDKNKLRL